jgi:hypothetical protein
MTTPEEFMQYFRVNYPTLPDWHARKIYAAAIAASGLAAAPELLDECKAILRDLVIRVTYSEEGRRKRIAQLETVIGKAEGGE